MLSQLSIRDFAIIENAVVEFDGGLNVITGETGAGKSIIVDALSLALGARANKESIRQGSEKTTVQAVFDIAAGSVAAEQVRQLGIDVEDQLIFSRQIYASGKNVCQINAAFVPVSELKRIGSLLVDIHGQHEHQSLYKVAAHLKYLDIFDKESGSVKEKTNTAYEMYIAARDAVEEVQRLSQDAHRQREELLADIAEIDALNLKVDEDEALEQKILRMRNSAVIAQYVNDAYEGLYAGEQNALKSVQGVFSSLDKAAASDVRLADMVDAVQNASILLEDAAMTLRDYIADMNFDEQDDIDALEERAYKITQLRRKFAPTIAEILALRDEKKTTLDTLENLDEEIARRQQAEQEARAHYFIQAKELSRLRTEAKIKLEKQIKTHLVDLAMPSAVFFVDIRRADAGNEIRRNGYDDVEFLFSANSGYEPRPLTKIASGGEMSRLMLALKVLIADEEISTLVFDEIDTGISGRTAQLTAEKLKRLAEKYQVLLITHLPQIAAVGQAHFSARKNEGVRAYTKLVHLNEAERVEELAKMMGGKNITQSTRLHAQQMLQMAKEI